jgi:hypothetical protein
MLNEGNELSIYQVDDPLAPREITRSRFDFGNRGDSDYDLVVFDVCDDCRNGVLGHKVERTVVFDLGIGAEPRFPIGAYDDIPVPNELSLGGYIFRIGFQQYLFAADVPGGCVGGSGLYTLDGLGSYRLIGCMEVGGSALLVSGLQSLTADHGIQYLYAAGSDGAVHIFRVDGEGIDVDLVYQSSPAGMFGRRSMLSIDAHNRRAASADYYGDVVTTWSLADPANPVLEHTIQATETIVSLRSPGADSPSTLFLAKVGQPRSTRTFVVDDGPPLEFEADFWSDASLPHNDLPICVFDDGGALSEGGSVLFLSRNAMFQVFDLTDCLGLPPALAEVGLTPSTVYPGESVTVTDTSTGRVDRWAVWVADESGAVVAGTDLPSDLNLSEISFQIPQDIAWNDTYRAHILVESDGLPPAREAFDAPINIDRGPQVTISASPPAVVIGEATTLTAAAQGVPSLDPYLWTIDPPLGGPFTRTGPSTVVSLNEEGLWVVNLVVAYDHLLAGGSPYQAVADPVEFDVTSVAADFTISPATPLHNEVITLDGSMSKPFAGNLSFAWRVESVSHDYLDCTPTDTCTIPAESLNPGTTYDITLEVTNIDDGATSELTKALPVGDGDLQPTITVSNTNPDIGANVLFTIADIPVDIDKATWSMGDAACDGADQMPECVPSLSNDCKALAFTYSSAGTKVVNLSIEIDGDVFDAPARTITVAPTGSCPGVWPCGNAGYDDGVTSGAAWFDGSSAGDSNSMYAVKFELADIGFLPGKAEISGFCAANQIDSTSLGGPWPNEVFIYPDSGGMPDDSVVLGQGTIWTGDGTGSSAVNLASPVTLFGDFWLVSRGDPQWLNEDFNMEYDSSANVGRSYSSETGVAGLAMSADGNYMLRATLRSGHIITIDGFESGTTSAWSSVVGE